MAATTATATPLLVGDAVEVAGLPEEGFPNSWSSGVLVEDKGQEGYVVQYPEAGGGPMAAPGAKRTRNPPRGGPWCPPPTSPAPDPCPPLCRPAALQFLDPDTHDALRETITDRSRLRPALPGSLSPKSLGELKVRRG